MMVLRNIAKVPAAYLTLRRHAKNPDNFSDEERWEHIRYVLRCAVEAGNVNVEVHGTENLPQQGSFLMCGNHQGLFDVFAIVLSCPLPLSVVFKKELDSYPLLREIVRSTKSFSMDREDVRQSMQVIHAVTDALLAGRRCVIFPEGTRSRLGNEMLPFHGGSFRCAVKAKCPVIPLAFVDSYKVLDQKGTSPVTMQLHYLPPIAPEEFEGMSAKELAALTQSRIAEKIRECTKAE